MTFHPLQVIAELIPSSAGATRLQGWPKDQQEMACEGLAGRQKGTTYFLEFAQQT